MVKTVYAKVKKQSVNARGTDNYLAHSVQRLYNKSASMLLLESILFIVVGLAILILRRVFKYKLVSCYDALYKEGRTLEIAKKEEVKDAE